MATLPLNAPLEFQIVHAFVVFKSPGPTSRLSPFNSLNIAQFHLDPKTLVVMAKFSLNFELLLFFFFGKN